ncbi:MAG: hypothetical protein PHV74_00350 [Dehalococcoidia bacterium]|nr:hypothetical protein [Dehalococcoidia bacterium]
MPLQVKDRVVEAREKQYIGSHVVGETVTGFHVKQGKAILEFNDGGTLEIGAKANRHGNPSVTLKYEDDEFLIKE